MRRTIAAALALTGWYLMTPPQTNGRFDSAAPLSQWMIEAGFPTGDACRKTLIELESRARQEGRSADVAKVKQARCLPTDDPRLKEN